MKLDTRITAPAVVLAKADPAHRDLTGLVTFLLSAHLKASAKRGKALCKAEGVEWPAELLS